MNATHCDISFRIGQRAMSKAALAAILALMVVLFSWNYSEFFGPDSIYYFARTVTSIPEIFRAFSTIDNRDQYRPMGMLLFSYVLFPLFGYSVLGHHLVPLCFHALNILLVYRISVRLFRDPFAAICASGFFALHRINFFVTYGLTFIPDFTGVFFFLTAFLLYLKHDEGRRWLVLSFCFWLCALFSKEVGVVFPAILFSYDMLMSPEAEPTGRFRASLKRTFVFWIAALGFVLLMVALRGGSLYPKPTAHPYSVSISVSALLTKVKYLWWAVNLPQGTGVGRSLAYSLGLGTTSAPIPQVRPFLALAAAVLLSPFILAFVGFLIRRLLHQDAVVMFGVAFFLLALSPVLLLSGRVMQHNLYFPLFGAALVFGASARGLLQQHYSVALLILPFAFVFSTGVGVHNNRHNSWPVTASRTSAEFLATFQSTIAGGLDCNTAVLVSRTGDPDLPWYTDGGNLFRVFGPCRDLKVYFEDLGQQPQETAVLRLHLKPGNTF